MSKVQKVGRKSIQRETSCLNLPCTNLSTVTANRHGNFFVVNIRDILRGNYLFKAGFT